MVLMLFAMAVGLVVSPLVLSIVSSLRSQSEILDLPSGSSSVYGQSSAFFSRESPLISSAQKVSPAVVSVGAIKTSYYVDDWFMPFFAYKYREKLPNLGSGVIFDKKGYVLTNYHVVENAEKVIVTLPDGKEIEAEFLGADRIVDIALLKVNAKNLPYADLGNSDDLIIGEWVIAIGNPFGNLIGDTQPTVTAGVVSALHRSFFPSGQESAFLDMIQTDAAINPGNSGGPLVNLNGEVVGISTYIFTTSGGSIGLNFAIPINRAREVTEEIITYGKIRPFFLDFEVIDITSRIARALGISSNDGAVVWQVLRGGPAEKAGLVKWDVILSVNSNKIANRNELVRYILAQHVGSRLELEIIRDGKKSVITYIIVEAK